LGRAGDGTFSLAIKGKYEENGEEIYALKIVDKFFVNKHRQTNRMILERKILDRLDDAGIVKLHFTFQDANNLCTSKISLK